MMVDPPRSQVLVGRCTGATSHLGFRAIDGGDAADPHGVGQQVEHAELSPPASRAHTRAAGYPLRKDPGSDPGQLEEFDRGHRYRRPQRHTRESARRARKRT